MAESCTRSAGDAASAHDFAEGMRQSNGMTLSAFALQTVAPYVVNTKLVNFINNSKHAAIEQQSWCN